jgi:hypothetical protein
MGDDDPWLCGHWFRGLSPEVKAVVDGRLIVGVELRSPLRAAFSLLDFGPPCLGLADFVAEIGMQTAGDGWCHF